MGGFLKECALETLPTHFIWGKLPSKVKFQSALECVGMDIELRFKKFSSILDTDEFVKINFMCLACKLTPTECEKF